MPSLLSFLVDVTLVSCTEGLDIENLETHQGDLFTNLYIIIIIIHRDQELSKLGLPEIKPPNIIFLTCEYNCNFFRLLCKGFAM